MDKLLYVNLGLILIIIFLIYKVLNYKQNIKTEQYKQEEKHIKQIKEKEKSVLEEVRKGYKEELNEYQQKSELIKKEYITLEDNIKEKISLQEKIIMSEQNRVKEIAEEKMKHELHIIKQKECEELQKEFEKFVKDISLKKEIAQEELQELTATVIEFKNKRDAINQQVLREREIDLKKDFYIVQLSQLDIEDIAILRTIESRLHNKQALNKLIYDVFYKKPVGELINRVLENRSFCGIYKITSQLTQEVYIGKSTNIKRRWTEHIKTSLDIGSVAKTRIHSALKEQGIENFTWEVLERCDKDVYTQRERFYIDFYESNVYGFNMTK